MEIRVRMTTMKQDRNSITLYDGIKNNLNLDSASLCCSGTLFPYILTGVDWHKASWIGLKTNKDVTTHKEPTPSALLSMIYTYKCRNLGIKLSEVSLPT